MIVRQFNPDTLQRSLAPKAAGDKQQGDRTEALRLTGPAVETIKFEADIDATDQFEVSAPNGIHPQLAALEMLINPPAARIRGNQALADVGTLEIAPAEAPLTLFVWGSKRCAGAADRADDHVDGVRRRPQSDHGDGGDRAAGAEEAMTYLSGRRCLADEGQTDQLAQDQVAFSVATQIGRERCPGPTFQEA